MWLFLADGVVRQAIYCCLEVLHPLLVAFACFVLFKVDAYQAMVVTSAAALPVAGNVYILAQHYGVAPQRVSAAILVSTAISIVSVSLWIAWLTGGTVAG